jgi:hypothetical protein
VHQFLQEQIARRQQEVEQHHHLEEADGELLRGAEDSL